jgi:hypothetical protein
MIVGKFYRVVPLFHGARVADARRGWCILALGVGAVVTVLLGVARESVLPFRAAAFFAAAALLLFGWEVMHVLSHRRSRAPDLNVSHWYVVAAYSAALACAAFAWGGGWIRNTRAERLGECVATAFLLGWVTQAIIGQLYKVTPFLMWYYRATVRDMHAIARLPDLYRPVLGRVVLWLSNMGVLALVAGVWSGAWFPAELGAILVAAAALTLAYMLAYRWIVPAASGRLAFQWRRRVS